jgi:hypothetical protein
MRRRPIMEKSRKKAKSLKTPIEIKQEMLRDGLCVWSIKTEMGTYDCGATLEPCCVMTDPKKCLAITDEKELYRRFYERDEPREFK